MPHCTALHCTALHCRAPAVKETSTVTPAALAKLNLTVAVVVITVNMDQEVPNLHAGCYHAILGSGTPGGSDLWVGIQRTAGLNLTPPGHQGPH